MWHYRQAINISSHTSTESNVYISTSINIDDASKAQSDGGDFRFIDQGGNLLSYYIFSGTGSTNITFHINFDSFPAGAQTLYVYYGNPSAPNGFSASDFSIAATNYSIGSLGNEESGGGPAAWWKFDEGIGTTLFNSSSTQNNGYFNSPAPNWVDESQCIYGKCLSFDGTQSAYSNYDISWNNTNNVSLSFWVKPQNTTDSQRGILGKQYSLYEWSIYQSGSSVSLVYWNTGGGHTNGMDDSWGNVLTTNKWTHLVYTWDGSTSRFYADGKIVKTKTAINPSINMNRTNNMMFGGNIYTWGNTFFRGLIDEVKIYNYLRTAEQIKQEYVNHGSIVNIGGTSIETPPGNLVAHYKFNENNGSSIHDSINNATGTVYNGATWVKTNLGVGLSLGGGGSNDYISLSNQPLNNATVWSISTELKYIHLARVYEFFLGQNDQTTGKILLGHNGYISFRGTNGTYYDFSTTSAEINNLDSNLIFISNGTTIKLYIDGIYKSSIAPASTSINIDSIGNAWTDTVWTSAFVINELKIYNTALTDDQIKQDYNRGSSVNFSVDKLDVGSTSASALYCVPGSTDPCSPPIAEWNFEESIGNTAYDSSSNSNNGILSGATLPRWSIGKIGSALTFNGINNYVVLPTSGGSDTKGNLGFADTDNFTISLWYKGSDTGTGDTSLGKTLVGRNSNDIYANFVVNGGYVEYIHFNGGWQHNIKSSFQVTDNKWHYISYVNYSNETGDLYIDGVKQISGLSSSIDSATRYFKADNLMSGYNNKYTSGELDQVRIYDYARTPAQIAWDYNQGAPVGHWKLDECQGTTIHDSSNNNNHGTLSIGAGGSQSSVGTCNTSSTAWGIGATGKINSSLSLDGTDDKATAGTITVGTNMTISAWIKKNISTGQKSFFSNRNGGNVYFGLTSTQIFLYDNAASPPNINSSSGTVAIGQWQHIVATSDGTTTNFYLNGVLVKSSPQNRTGSTGTIGIGWDPSIGTEYWDGQIDDVRIYNYALTSDQIKQIYNGGAINFN